MNKELADWQTLQGLPASCAFEQMSDDVTQEQHDWLDEFVTRYDEYEAGKLEHAPHYDFIVTFPAALLPKAQSVLGISLFADASLANPAGLTSSGQLVSYIYKLRLNIDYIIDELVSAGISLDMRKTGGELGSASSWTAYRVMRPIEGVSSDKPFSNIAVLTECEKIGTVTLSQVELALTMRGVGSLLADIQSKRNPILDWGLHLPVVYDLHSMTNPNPCADIPPPPAPCSNIDLETIFTSAGFDISSDEDRANMKRVASDIIFKCAEQTESPDLIGQYSWVSGSLFEGLARKVAGRIRKLAI
jgi:hypothetical protein